MTRTWIMQHESGNQICVMGDTSLALAQECGYRWVNRNDGEGWRQISIEVRKAEIRAAVGA